MHVNWKLALVSACALLLLLALGTRAGWHGRADGRAPAIELDAPAIVEVRALEPAPRATTAERCALADTDVAPAPRSAHTEPTAGSVAGAFSLSVTFRELGSAPLAPSGSSVHAADESGQGDGTATNAKTPVE